MFYTSTHRTYSFQSLWQLKLIGDRDLREYIGRNLERRRDGEATGEDEGGGVCALTFPAEGDDWALERFAFQDSSQDLRELDQRNAFACSSRRHLLVSLISFFLSFFCSAFRVC